jgi:hypothetical protein
VLQFNNRNNSRDRVEINEKCIAGMNDYISKPIIKRVIEDALVKWTTTSGIRGAIYFYENILEISLLLVC